MKLLIGTALLALVSSASPFLPAPGHRPTAHLARPTAADSTTVRLQYGTADAELNDLMGHMLGIEKHHLLLHDHRLAGRHLHLTLQEYRRGVAGPEQALDHENSLTQLDSAGRYQFTIYARQVAGDKVENLFALPRASMPRRFAAATAQASNYSLRFDIHALRRAADQTGGTATNPITEFKLPIGSPAVLAVYTLPYEKDGMLYYCNLAQSRVPVADWYAKFKVPHFVVYRVRVE